MSLFFWWPLFLWWSLYGDVLGCFYPSFLRRNDTLFHFSFIYSDIFPLLILGPVWHGKLPCNITERLKTQGGVQGERCHSSFSWWHFSSFYSRKFFFPWFLKLLPSEVRPDIEVIPRCSSWLVRCHPRIEPRTLRYNPNHMWELTEY